jgi:hypothetical protein
MRTTHLTRRRSTAFLSAAVLAASGIVASMGAAEAVVTGGGGNNAEGTPTFYRDAQGFALELCLDGTPDAQCEPAVDGIVGVYFAAGAAAGPLLAEYDITATDNADVPGGPPLVNNAARFRLSGAKPNTTYTIKDPWRTSTCRTNALGRADCRHDTSGNPTSVRTGWVSHFLRTIGPSSGQFIGSHVNANRVTGSPTGFNKVVVTGGGQSFSTNQFELQGQKLANTAMSSLSNRSLMLGTGRQTAVVTKNVRYSSVGTAAARPTVRKGGLNPGAFTVQNQCASQAPGSACNIVVKFNPRQNANAVKRAFLVIDDNGLAAPRKVSLKGVGTR